MLKLEPEGSPEAGPRGRPQTRRCFLYIVHILSNMVTSPHKIIVRCPTLRKQTPLFSDTTSRGQDGAVPLAGCRSSPGPETLPDQLFLFLPSPRKLVRLLLTLARPPVPVFLDTWSFSFVVCTSRGHSLKAPAYSLLLMFPIFDRGRLLSCWNQDVPTARPEVPSLAPAPAAWAPGFSWA